MSQRQRKWLVCSVLLVGACSEAPRSEPPSAPPYAVEGRRALSPMMRAHTGFTHLPEVVDRQAFAASLRRHHPPELRGVTGTTLVDVHVDAQGRVQRVDVVRRPSTASVTAFVQDGATRRVLKIDDRPEFGAAAQAVLRETRFMPALKDGLALPYKTRMTIQFSP